MQLEVREGSRILWVEEFGCFLEDGEPAFSYYGMPPIIPPIWLRSPLGSILRLERNSNNPEHPNEEIRNLQADASEIIKLYAECGDTGGLTRIDSPVVNHALEMTELSRVEPGFFAENDDYRFSLEVFQHHSTSFWRIKHGRKLPPSFRSKKEPDYLILVERQGEKVILRNPETGDDLWAPSTALTDEEPRHANHPRHKTPEDIPISWTILPKWLQLQIEPRTETTASRAFTGGALAGFSAMRINDNLHDAIERLLNQLDEFGFDAQGVGRPDHSYFLQPMTGGRHVSIHVNAHDGDKAILTFVHTRQEPILYAFYSTDRTLEDLLNI